ncbi:MAG TPA: dihydrodipicolinate synthase family protein [Gaiellaceae bacterium]|nr:dihydrodipicolinate synthase family protein [Gaiellaceae bacterium]
MPTNWRGVLPALTTPFTVDLEVDHPRLADHCSRLVDAGCVGVVPGGSLGEGATLAAQEKVEIFRTCVDAVGSRAAVVPGIAALSTADAVHLARAAEQAGCHGLMVLPAYAYPTDWREAKQHVAAVIAATSLPCMLYNNPVAYGTDFVPEQIAELAAEQPNLLAVKESSTDVRRITELKRLLGDRLELLVGVDDLIVEGVAAGAVGWIAGLVNAFPDESVALFQLARDGNSEEAARLYDWFLPLLRLDTKPKLVQLIKLAQELVGQGDWRSRPPRLALDESERADATAIIQHALENRVLAAAA